MPTCEKCWRDAHGDAEEYSRLIDERDARDEECTPEQQAGPDATRCPHCDRMTRHQHCRICVICGRGGDAETAQGER